jgi:uncharacterized protein with HEPN domain
MRSDAALRALSDISYNIRHARNFTAGMDFSAFCADEKTLYAVIRCLEIVSEASRRLTPELRARHPAVPWAQIAGAGNVFRHDYEDVLPRIVWNTVIHQLSDLEAAIDSELGTLKPT